MRAVITGFTLAFVYGLGPALRAEEIEWRTAKTATRRPTPPPPVAAVPSAAIEPAMKPVRWVRSEPLVELDILPEPIAEPRQLPRGTALTEPAAPQNPTGAAHPNVPAAPPSVLPQLPDRYVLGSHPDPVTGEYPIYLVVDDPIELPLMAARVPRFYARAEFLLWALKGDRLPPMATSAPLGADAPAGAVGAAGTRILVTGSDLDNRFRAGGRLTLGGTLDPEGKYGVEGSIFFFGNRRGRRDIASSDAQIFRPFFAANPFIDEIGGAPGEFYELVYDNINSTGNLAIENRGRFWGGDANFRKNLWCCCCDRLDLLTGFRYLNLDESLSVIEDIRLKRDNLDPPLAAGTRILVLDSFATRNDFYGWQVGFDYERRRGPWSLSARPMLALGVTRQQLTVSGSQSILRPDGGRQDFEGGLLALDSNIGRRTRTPFTVVPQVALVAGYQMTERLRVFAGYDFLYWSSVIRPGDQIDRTLDITRIPNFPNDSRSSPTGVVPAVPEVRPAALFRRTDFFAHGVNLGAEYRW